MEPLIQLDKSVKPTDELVFSVIGNNREFWVEFFATLKNQYPDAQGDWNYYNDGKNWLFKMVRKKKTIFWIGLHQDTFRITFYFGDKTEPVIEKSDLPEHLIEGFKTGKRYGKIRAISFKVAHSDDVENALKLAEIKVKNP